ncbi:MULTISPECIES: sigma factor-like helix-turn-helix DNA-binding protein [Helicobacter]|uniref:RNA polymerase subunit sigma-70 n=1 Tax=Helicobacter apodemus TaxID=135569 RepID=A0A4U8UD27_9HELI|nr:sigma factor-like helix-turn-helix DNA-binding protein [Helicobacter apodemus]TLE14496.1 RNA polymerase subunit sigma-70 [Helicobacter apodemus]
MTFEEIGKVLGISEERTRRIYHKAIAKLSHPRNKDKWRKVLETLEEIQIEKIKSDSNTLDWKEV